MFLGTQQNGLDQAVWLAACMGKLFQMSEQ
jgi:hypothetical protein